MALVRVERRGRMERKNPARKPRGARALHSGLRALNYEWLAARSSAKLVRQARKSNDNEIMNVALESLLIHGRNICEFFRASARKNDILAVDFLGRTPRVCLTYLRKNMHRIHRRVAHLSYSRPYMKRGWDSERMIKEIDAALELFFERLPINHPSIAGRVFLAR